MRILIFMGEHRDARVNPVWRAAREELEGSGSVVDLAFASDATWDVEALARRYDRFVLKSRSPFWLAIAGALDSLGCDLLHGYRATLRVIDKLDASVALRAAGLPVPEVLVPGGAFGVGAERWIWKPTFGHRGQGVHPVDAPVRADPRDPGFVQRCVEHDGFDLKVKVLDQQVAAFRRRFDPDQVWVRGEAAALDDDTRALALRVGEALDLSMYGLDLLRTPDGVRIVDVNGVPSYRQFPAWAGELARHLSRERA